MDIRTAIKILSKTNLFESILGSVVSVDLSAKTCVVQPLDDQPQILDVRLSADEGSITGHIIIPTLNSFVIVGQTANEQPHIVMFSEVESITTVIKEVEHRIDENGLKLTVGSNDLKEGLIDLKTAINQLKVMTPQGQSSIPININNINAAFDKMLATLQ